MGIFFTVFGGVGLFLLGMIIMTDGLKAIAGNSLKEFLGRFTGGTFSSILSGGIITAIIQSSSATVLMTIGFVSAGLLTFSQSIGVVIGANIGSTSIGWIVSAIGFKVSMGLIALPLVGTGAFLRFLSKGRYSSHGMAVAGLGMLFLGIDILQNGMASLTSIFSLQFLGSPSILQLFLLIVIGVVMTVVMQSSGAAFIITLSALVADTITFEQAAALAIGQNVGTTIKAYVATIGGTVAAKRTALAHIWFNLFTGAVALILFPWLIPGVIKFGNMIHIYDVAILLSLLNTLMYLIGVVVVVPILPYFTKFIARLVPDRGQELVKYLDPNVAEVPAVAIEAMRRTLIKITKAIAHAGSNLFDDKANTLDIQKQLATANSALIETRQFLSKINHELTLLTTNEYRQQVAIVHIIDHLDRLLKALSEEEIQNYLDEHFSMEEPMRIIEELFAFIKEDLTYDEMTDLVYHAEDSSLRIAELRRINRKDIFEKTVQRQSNVDSAIKDVHTLHWVDRIAYHTWRGLFHIYVCSLQDRQLEEVERQEQVEMEVTVGLD